MSTIPNIHEDNIYNLDIKKPKYDKNIDEK